MFVSTIGQLNLEIETFQKGRCSTALISQLSEEHRTKWKPSRKVCVLVQINNSNCSKTIKRFIIHPAGMLRL